LALHQLFVILLQPGLPTFLGRRPDRPGLTRGDGRDVLDENLVGPNG